MKKTVFAAGILLFIFAGCGELVNDDNIFTVTFNPAGGEINESNKVMKTGRDGRLARMPMAERQGYTFQGWYTSGNTRVTERSVFSRDVTLFAKWQSGSGGPGSTHELSDWLDSLPGLVAASARAQASLEFDWDTEILDIDKNQETIAPRILEFQDQEVTIVLRGRAYNPIKGSEAQSFSTIGCSRNGATFTVGKGVTLKLEDIRLSGQGRNTHAIIIINNGGTVILENNVTLGGEGAGNGNEGLKQGGAVTVTRGAELVMNGGLIAENTNIPYGTDNIFDSRDGGGAVYVRGGKFTMTGGTIYDNYAIIGGGVLIADGGEFEMTGGKIHKNEVWLSGPNVAVVDRDVRNDKDSSFTMYGGEIYNGSGGAGGGVFVIRYGHFYMHGGEIKNNTRRIQVGAGVYVGPRGAFYMYGGKIIDNIAMWDAGGVSNNGYFEMYDGAEISGNRALMGGGVASGLEAFGTRFIMYGGKISNNRAKGGGGGVGCYGHFAMHGGEISGNWAETYRGGGLLLDGDAGFQMTGGVIYGRDEPIASLRNLDFFDTGGAGTAAIAIGDNTNPDDVGALFTKLMPDTARQLIFKTNPLNIDLDYNYKNNLKPGDPGYLQNPEVPTGDFYKDPTKYYIEVPLEPYAMNLNDNPAKGPVDMIRLQRTSNTLEVINEDLYVGSKLYKDEVNKNEIWEFKP